MMDLMFPIWKPAPGSDGSSHVRIRAENAVALQLFRRQSVHNQYVLANS